MNKLKIALVKQEVYQDLYVCPVTEKDPGQILFSSMGRVGDAVVEKYDDRSWEEEHGEA